MGFFFSLYTCSQKKRNNHLPRSLSTSGNGGKIRGCTSPHRFLKEKKGKKPVKTASRKLRIKNN